MAESQGTLNLVDILDIAVQMEKKAVIFYREASERFEDISKKSSLLAMSKMEEEHVRLFCDLRESAANLTGNEIEDDEEFVEIDYAFWFDKSLFEMNDDLSKILDSLKTFKDIVLFAIEMENRSILFYSGLRKFVGVVPHGMSSTRSSKKNTATVAILLGCCRKNKRRFTCLKG